MSSSIMVFMPMHRLHLRRILSITSSHDDNHDYASSASPVVPNATLEMHGVEIERDADDCEGDDDEIDDESEDEHHQEPS